LPSPRWARARPLLADLNTTGLLFESLAVRDLRVYSQSLRGEVMHYRDESGLEVDAIVAAGDSSWLAAEVKLSPSPEVVDVAAAQLLKFATRVDTSRCGEPAALVVITATGYAYRRSDGVTVVPIGTLGP
jgi:predicted AAA+ superfamily ATPase